MLNLRRPGAGRQWHLHEPRIRQDEWRRALRATRGHGAADTVHRQGQPPARSDVCVGVGDGAWTTASGLAARRLANACCQGPSPSDVLYRTWVLCAVLTSNAWCSQNFCPKSHARDLVLRRCSHSKCLPHTHLGVKLSLGFPSGCCRYRACGARGS